MRIQAPRRELETTATAPAAKAVVELSAALNEGMAIYRTLLATGMDSFEAIAPAAQGDRTVTAHLWLEALRMVEIPAGTFKMGSPHNEEDRDKDEGPQHMVMITRPFGMGALTVTQGCWEALMGSNPSHFAGDPRLPVEQVSWKDICGPDGFLDRLNALTEGTRPEGQVFRLPTEAEWEYACRAGTTTAYSFGSDWANVGDYAWNVDNSNERPHPVGQKKPNAWGLYDMHGNMWEWCLDVWHDTYKGAPQDGSAWVEGGDHYQRIIRGECWHCKAQDTRPAFRYKLGSDNQNYHIGFRLVLAGMAP